MSTWHNLPCAPTLHAVSQLCPRGWIEVGVTYYPGSTAGGIAQDAEMSVEIERLWGVAEEDREQLVGLIHELAESGEMPAGREPVTVLVRVVPDARRCSVCRIPVPEGHEGFLCPKAGDDPLDGCTGIVYEGVRLDARWGTERRPVWTADEAPTLTVDQPAPRPGSGDMWAQFIERRRGELRPELIALFERRRALGIERYGTVLQAGNGRDVIRDLVDETLDRIAYLEQAATEQPSLAFLFRGAQDQDVSFLGALALATGDRAIPGVVAAIERELAAAERSAGLGGGTAT